MAVEALFLAFDEAAESTVGDGALLAVEGVVLEAHAEGLADLTVVGLSGEETVSAQFFLTGPALDIGVGRTDVHGGVRLVTDLANALFVALVATLAAKSLLTGEGEQ